MRHGPAWVIEQLNKGEKVDPSQYYFRTTPWFETASEKYRFLNRIVCVATGRRDPTGPVYEVSRSVGADRCRAPIGCREILRSALSPDRFTTKGGTTHGRHAPGCFEIPART